MAGKKKSSKQDSEFRKALYSAARSLNWFFPQTEEEVAASEEEVQPSDSEERGDPLEALDRELGFSKRPAGKTSTAHEYEQELSRAARLGKGKVPEAIEDRMRQDREQAEQEEDGS